MEGEHLEEDAGDSSEDSILWVSSFYLRSFPACLRASRVERIESRDNTVGGRRSKLPVNNPPRNDDDDDDVDNEGSGQFVSECSSCSRNARSDHGTKRG